MGRQEGKVAFIAAAAQGMGAKHANRFVGKGASASVLIHRFGGFADVSNPLALLASEEAGFVTGSETTIDGGLNAL